MRHLVEPTILVLGPFEVIGVAARDLGGPRQRAVLAALALRQNVRTSRDTLVADVWADPPAQVTATLHGYLSHLRKALAGSSVQIESAGSSYRLVGDERLVDAVAFESEADAASELLVSAAEADVERAATAATAALARWRGRPFEGLGDPPFASRLTPRLEQLRLTARLTQARAHLRLDQPAEAAVELADLICENPLNEEACGLLMVALFRSGRQTEALEIYRRTRDRLADELGVDPEPALQALHTALLRQDEALPAPFDVRHPTRVSVPADDEPTTRFIGREDEVAALRSLMAGYRLVTLSGPGGAGKTRLATEVTRDDSDRVLVELADVSDPAEVDRAVAAAIGVVQETRRPVRDLVLRRLGSRLMLIDNCEHVLEAVADLVADVLRHCPQARVLTTSRTPLGVTGETVYVVPPLDTNVGAAAVELFLDRARLAANDFDPQPAELRRISGLCHHLDGMPLAIELAAAHCRTLPVGELDRLLDDRFRLLVADAQGRRGRQASLRATLEWSYRLLQDDEQTLFRRLSVLAGGFDLAAAEAVGGRPDTYQTLRRLVLASMMSRESPEAILPFRLLETVRAFAAELLAADEEEHAEARRRHAEHFASLVHRATRFDDGEDVFWVERLNASAGDIVAALDWHLAHSDDEALVALAVGVSRYWSRRARFADAQAMLTGLLDRGLPGALTTQVHLELARLGTMSDQTSLVVRHAPLALEGTDDRHLKGWALAHLSLGQFMASVPGATQSAEEALSIGVELDDPALQCWARIGLASSAQMDADLPRALEELREAERLARLGGQQHLLATTQTELGTVCLHLGLYAESSHYWDQCRLYYESVGDLYALSHAHGYGSRVPLARGALDDALASAQAGLALAMDIDYPWAEAIALMTVGDVAVARGNPAEGLAPLRRARDIFSDYRYPEMVGYATVSYARALLHLGHVADAEHAIEEALAGYSDRSRARSGPALNALLGLAFARQGRDRDAERVCRMAVRTARARRLRPALALAESALATVSQGD